jgi:hypothetical protein
MTDTDELIAFVRRCLDTWERRLADDERIALAATPGPWQATVTENGLAGDVEHVTYCHDDYYCCSAADATYIARWDPARVLDEVAFGRADIEAKRELIGVIVEYEQTVSGDSGFTVGELVAPSALLLLAQPYAGWDGWREEWHADVMPS